MSFLQKIFLVLLFCIALAGNVFTQITRVDIPNGYYAFSFQEDATGKVWLGLSDGNTLGGIGVYSNNSVAIISGTDSLPAGSYHTSLKLPDGSFMFTGHVLGSNGKPLLVWISSSGVDTIQIPFKLSNPLVNTINLINRRDVWIGTASGLLINARGDWKRITTGDGLPNMSVTTIYQDFRGVIWVGTDSGIAYFIDGVMYHPEKGSRIISTATNFFGDSRGYVWCGARFASEGVSVYNGELWQTFSGRNGLIDNSVSHFYQDQDANLWVGGCYSRTRGGVSVFDGKKWEGYGAPEYLAKPCVDAIISDAKGRVWLGGSLTHQKQKGITVYDQGKWIKIRNSKELPAERVIAFYRDKAGNLWISSLEGLFIVDKEFDPTTLGSYNER